MWGMGLNSVLFNTENMKNPTIDTVPRAEILSGKNARSWDSMDFT